MSARIGKCRAHVRAADVDEGGWRDSQHRHGRTPAPPLGAARGHHPAEDVADHAVVQQRVRAAMRRGRAVPAPLHNANGVSFPAASRPARASQTVPCERVPERQAASKPAVQEVVVDAQSPRVHRARADRRTTGSATRRERRPHWTRASVPREVRIPLQRCGHPVGRRHREAATSLFREVGSEPHDSRSSAPDSRQIPPNGAGASRPAKTRGRASHQRQDAIHRSPPPVGLTTSTCSSRSIAACAAIAAPARPVVGSTGRSITAAVTSASPSSRGVY